MKNEIKKAIESAEQEIQEREIAQLKSIVKNLLEKKAKLEEEKREIEKEISIIKQTIDDFKAGRLDKVKELIEKDGVARNVLPFKVMVFNQPVYTQPWNWTYSISSDTTGSIFTGNVCSNFTSGTYSLNNGRIINL